MKRLILTLLLAWIAGAHADVTLQYQNRGDRYEGIKPKPVAGYDIELPVRGIDAVVSEYRAGRVRGARIETVAEIRIRPAR